jgi:hypothetical protein
MIKNKPKPSITNMAIKYSAPKALKILVKRFEDNDADLRKDFQSTHNSFITIYFD